MERIKYLEHKKKRLLEKYKLIDKNGFLYIDSNKKTAYNILRKKINRINLKLYFEFKRGDKGGYIEKIENLSGNAWVYGDARVSGSARVYGNAWVSEIRQDRFEVRPETREQEIALENFLEENKIEWEFKFKGD